MSTFLSLPQFLLRFARKEQSLVRSLWCPFWCFCSLVIHGVTFFLAVNFCLPQLVLQWDTFPSWGNMLLFPDKASYSHQYCSCLPYLLIFKSFSQHLVHLFCFFFRPWISSQKLEKIWLRRGSVRKSIWPIVDKPEKLSGTQQAQKEKGQTRTCSFSLSEQDRLKGPVS